MGDELRTALAQAPWKRFVALGDSVTEGYGSDPVEGLETIPWPQRVAAALREVQPDLVFENLGWRNLVAAEVRERQLDRALELEPDLAAICAGANDLLVPEFDPAPVERELDAIFSALAATGATLVTYTYMDLSSSGLLPEDGARVLRERMVGLHGAILACAERHGALVVDMWNHPRGSDPACWSSDLMHGNALAHKLVADATVERLARHLEEERRPAREELV